MKYNNIHPIRHSTYDGFGSLSQASFAYFVPDPANNVGLCIASFVYVAGEHYSFIEYTGLNIEHTPPGYDRFRVTVAINRVCTAWYSSGSNYSGFRQLLTTPIDNVQMTAPIGVSSHAVSNDWLRQWAISQIGQEQDFSYEDFVASGNPTSAIQ